MNGLLITFEGIDFCGKSVQVKKLIEQLNKHKLDHILLREPGGTIFSEKIRDILLTKEDEEMNPVTEFLLFSAARAQLSRKVILPSLEIGKIVICDRFYDSSTAYQGYARGMNLDFINQINLQATDKIKPDLTFLIDIDTDEMINRRNDAQLDLDRMEDQAIGFFKKVRDGYLKIAHNEPERFYVIDGKKTIDQISDEIWQSVKNTFKTKH